MPIALLPPPTHARTYSGSALVASAYWRLGLVADHPLQVAHQLRERVGTDDRADDVVGVPHGRGPVAQRLVHRFLQRLGPGGDRHDLGAQQLHACHVGRLAADVFLAHVHDARKAEEGAGRGAGHAVLAGAGLGDDALLAQSLRDQRLAQGVVDLVRPGVRQVLPLEPDVVAELGGQPPGGRDRRGPPDELAREGAELGEEPRIGAQRPTMPRPARPGRGSAPPGRTARRRSRTALGRRAPPRPRAAGRVATLMSSTPLPVSARTAARGSPARIRASPTRMADAPAATAASTSAASRDPALHHRDPVGRDPAQPLARRAPRRPRASPGRARSRRSSARRWRALDRDRASEWVSSRTPRPEV